MHKMTSFSASLTTTESQWICIFIMIVLQKHEEPDVSWKLMRDITLRKKNDEDILNHFLCIKEISTLLRNKQTLY